MRLLQEKFHLTNLGQMRNYLKIEFLQLDTKIFITQQRFIPKMLDQFGMENCNPCCTPMAEGVELSKEMSGAEEVDSFTYRQIVGTLLYLTNTRPDISYAVGVVSRFMTKPLQPHMDAAKRILRYLKVLQILESYSGTLEGSLSKDLPMLIGQGS